jgi:hypothetical protein
MNIHVLQDVTPNRLLTDGTPETSVTTYKSTGGTIPAETCAVLLAPGGPRNELGQITRQPIAVAKQSAAD